VRMPMVFVDDLMRGLIALQEADEETLIEPEHGYCLPGLSFSPNELFAEIRKHHPGFGFRVELDANMNTFAKLWPDELSTEAPLRDLGYKPDVGLEEMVASVLKTHDARNETSANDWMTIDRNGDGTVTRKDIELHVRRFLSAGRSTYGHSDQYNVIATVDKFMAEFNDTDGLISWQKFSEWNRANNIVDFVRANLVSWQYEDPIEW